MRIACAACRLFPANDADLGQFTPDERNMLRKAHQTLRHVTEDMEGRWHFNTDVAMCMELVNELAELEGAG